MMQVLDRPHFYPGQLVDYRDFNRLSAQSDAALALLCRNAFEGGGILLEVYGELNVTPFEGLKVRLSKGTALLPSGYPLVIDEERVIDISEALQMTASSTETSMIIVSAKNQLRAKDKHVDADDQSITGFKTETFVPEILYTTEAVPEGALELFRVHLPPQCRVLRKMTAEEEWQFTGALVGRGGDGLIDVRFRKTFLPHSYTPLSIDQLVSLRIALYQIEQSLKRIAKIYFVKDRSATSAYLAQLHSEVLSRPFQALKVAFLISELSEKIALYLELLSTKVGRERVDFNRELLLKLMTLLETMRIRYVLPQKPDLGKVVELSVLLAQLVQYAESKFNLFTTVREALEDIRFAPYEFSPNIILGGHVFKQVDQVEPLGDERLTVEAEFTQKRSVSSHFETGERVSLPGVFISQGTFSLALTVTDAQRPVLVMLKQHVRRSGTIVHYEVNGKHLCTETQIEAPRSNMWMNYGLMIPAELLVSRLNSLKIKIEKTDLDFGFMGATVYQTTGVQA